MNEQQRAKFYHDHKDDLKIWGDTEGRDPPAKRRNLGISITVRLSAEESVALRQMAKAKDVSYAEIIREALKLYTGSGRPLEERVWSIDYRSTSIFKPPVPIVSYEEGFNPGPKIPTGSLTPAGPVSKTESSKTGQEHTLTTDS